MSTPLKSHPILLDMAATCGGGAADLPSPTHVAADVGGLTTLDYAAGVCDVLQADPAAADWRRAAPSSTVHRPSYDDVRSSIDCLGGGDLGGPTKWNAAAAVDDDVEFDGRLCWAAYHHHVPPPGDRGTSVPSPTTSSFRPSPRTAASTVARTHVYEMPQFQS